MAVNEIKSLTANTWTQLTDADATSITVIHRFGPEVILQAVVGANAPASSDRKGLPIATGNDGLPNGFLKKALADMTHTSSPTRVYARAMGADATVYVETD